MSDPGPEPSAPRWLVPGLVLTLALGVLVDGFTLLLLPWRVSGHAVPLAQVLALLGNAALGYVAGDVLRSRAPAKALVGLALVLSVAGASSGPGGDLVVTRDLQTGYLAYVVAAALGAALPLLSRRRTTQLAGPSASPGAPADR